MKADYYEPLNKRCNSEKMCQSSWLTPLQLKFVEELPKERLFSRTKSHKEKHDHHRVSESATFFLKDKAPGLGQLLPVRSRRVKLRRRTGHRSGGNAARAATLLGAWPRAGVCTHVTYGPSQPTGGGGGGVISTVEKVCASSSSLLISSFVWTSVSKFSHPSLLWSSASILGSYLQLS